MSILGRKYLVVLNNLVIYTIKTDICGRKCVHCASVLQRRLNQYMTRSFLMFLASWTRCPAFGLAYSLAYLW